MKKFEWHFVVDKATNAMKYDLNDGCLAVFNKIEQANTACLFSPNSTVVSNVMIKESDHHAHIEHQKHEMRVFLEAMADATDENGYNEHTVAIKDAIDHLTENGFLSTEDPEEDTEPKQLVNEKAISWLFDNHPEIYKRFYALS